MGVSAAIVLKNRYDYINTSNPTVDVNPPSTPANWLNTTTGEEFVCDDNTIDNNVWIGSNRTIVSSACNYSSGTLTTLFSADGESAINDSIWAVASVSASPALTPAGDSLTVVSTTTDNWNIKPKISLFGDFEITYTLDFVSASSSSTDVYFYLEVGIYSSAFLRLGVNYDATAKEVYVRNPSSNNSYGVSETSIQFKLVRSGGTMTGLYYYNGEWAVNGNTNGLQLSYPVPVTMQFNLESYSSNEKTFKLHGFQVVCDSIAFGYY